MNHPFRGALYGIGLSLPFWGLIASFFSVGWFLGLVTAGMVCLLIAEATPQSVETLRVVHRDPSEL